MRRRHEQFIDVIIFKDRHSLYSASSAVLAAEIVDGHSLDITALCHRHNRILARDQIFCRNIVHIKTDRCTAGIAVFFRDSQNFLADNAKQHIAVGKNCLILSDLFHQFRIFCLQLLSFQTCQSPQTHVHDGLSLNIGQLKPVHQLLLGDLYVLRSADYTDHFVDIIQRLQKTFQDMSPLLRLVEIVLRSSGHNIFLMCQIIVEHLIQVQNFRLQASFVRNQTEQIYTKCILKLRMFKQLIENNIRVGVFSQIDLNTHAFSAGMVIQIDNTFDLFVTDQLCDLFDQTRFVDQIRKFGHNDTGTPVRKRLNVRHRTYTDLTAACAIRLFNTPASEDGGTRRKIRTLDDIEDLFHGGLPVFLDDVVDDLYDRIDHFFQVMRRNVCGHTDRNTRSTVYQKVRVSRRQNNRLPLRLIKVWLEIDGIFIDIRQHLHRNLAQPCFRISHGRSTVAVHRTEVSVSVNQRISRRPLLRHIDQRPIDGAVAVRMIFTHGIADDTGTFTVRLVRSVVQFDHRIKDSPLYRLQTVSDIRKSTRCDNTHGVVDVGFLHGPFQVYLMNFIKNIVFHSLFSRLNIQILHKSGVFFDKLASGFDLISHKGGKCQIDLRLRRFVHRYLQKYPALRIHRGFPKLLGIHLTESFVTLDLVIVVPSDFLQNRIQLIIIVCIPHLAVLLDLVKRRLCQIHITLLDQFRHKSVQESKQQCCDMRTVNIGIRHDDNLVVTQFGNIKIFVYSRAERGDHRLDLGVGINTVEPCLFHIQDLASKRKDGLCSPVSGCLGRTACRISLNDVDLTVFGIFVGTVRQLSGQGHAVQSRFTSGQVSRFTGSLSGSLCKHGLVYDRFRHRRVLLQIDLQLFADHIVDRRSGLAVAQFDLCLGFKLRVLDLYADDCRKTLSDILTA